MTSRVIIVTWICTERDAVYRQHNSHDAHVSFCRASACTACTARYCFITNSVRPSVCSMPLVSKRIHISSLFDGLYTGLTDIILVCEPYMLQSLQKFQTPSAGALNIRRLENLGCPLSRNLYTVFHKNDPLYLIAHNFGKYNRFSEFFTLGLSRALLMNKTDHFSGPVTP